MTWIFWRKVSREERAMFVCSVFFQTSQRSARCVQLKCKIFSRFKATVFLTFEFWCSYFCIRQHDVNILMFWVLEKSERCLCAPFFLSHFLKLIFDNHFIPSTLLSTFLKKLAFDKLLFVIVDSSFLVVFAEDNMTWIFWCTDFWEEWEMFVCSVFFCMFSENYTCQRKTKL